MPQMQYQSKSRSVLYSWTFIINTQREMLIEVYFSINKVETLEIAQRFTIKVKSSKREFSYFDINL